MKPGDVVVQDDAGGAGVLCVERLLWKEHVPRRISATLPVRLPAGSAAQASSVAGRGAGSSHRERSDQRRRRRAGRRDVSDRWSHRE